MVYNNAVYTPASLSERLQAKFGERTAKAVFRASSNDQAASADKKNQNGEVLSFFGRVDDAQTANRAIPSRRRVARNQEAHTAPNKAQAKQVRTAPVHAVNKQNIRPIEKTNVRPAQTNVRREVGKYSPRANTRKNSMPASPEITGTFTRAYAAGEQVRRAVSDYSASPRKRYAQGVAPSGALRRGRSNIPGARHAVLVTNDAKTDHRNIIGVIKDAFSDRHVAEHRVKKAPFPLAFVTLIGICAFMVMVLIFSFSQIHEYNSNINDLKSTQSELAEKAAKLEVQLEERDDIRNIEKIAVEEIGMVSSDMVQAKFVSVSASDRVEVLKNDTEEEEGGVSALLSVIGESLGKIGEYFN